MHPILNAQWLHFPKRHSEAVVEFLFSFSPQKPVKSASLQMTALGIYAAALNGLKVGGEVLAPGWTNYRKRLQYQTYDVTALLADGENKLSVEVARGWRMHAREKDWLQPTLGGKSIALIGALTLSYEDGTEEIFCTSNEWQCRLSKTRYSNIYNGEFYDAGFEDGYLRNAKVLDYPHDILIPLQGERIVEVERLPVQSMFTTPEGELVLDFGQLLTGYVEFRIEGKQGKKGILRHAEILDAKGNFYTTNLRKAKQEIEFVCDGQEHVYKPQFTFQGFRYVQPKNWPCEVKPEDFTAIVVHSEMKRTGYFECSDPLLNRLFENIVWGQKGNFLDIPTDCPQRDERLGWTGDAQAFIRTSCYIYDCERFWVKWLSDLASEQAANGAIPHVIPRMHWDGDSSTGWADAAVICPWQLYLSYGNRDILLAQYASMQAWVDYMIARVKNSLWLGGSHFGDWLNLDGDKATPKEVLQNAFFIYSTGLLVKSGELLGLDMGAYEKQQAQAKQAFCETYIKDGKLICYTQTACVLALYFGIAEGELKTSVAAQLAKLILDAGHLKTGFLGTPYLLHVLGDNGYTELAYDLLLRKEYPSWLYPVTMGATTVWERWDGQRPDGSFQDAGMNSFNHYAYGAVGDWMLGAAAGIQIDEANPGFKHIIFAPLADARLDHLSAEIETRHGLVRSGWRKTESGFEYEFTVPEGCTAEIRLGGQVTEMGAGTKTVTA